MPLVTCHSLSQVDIDERVIAVSRELLPEISAPCYSDPRTRVVVADAAAWLAKKQRAGHEASFDAVIIDSTDFGASGPLRTRRFYSSARAVLREGGVLCHNFGSPAWSLAHPIGSSGLDDVFEGGTPGSKVRAKLATSGGARGLRGQHDGKACG